MSFSSRRSPYQTERRYQLFVGGVIEKYKISYGLVLEAADVGNAYLEVNTNEKVCFVAGPSFGRYGLDGHLLAIEKALYGLRNSGAC